MGKKVPIVNYDWWTIGISALAFLAGFGSFIYARLTYNEQQKTVGLVDKSKAQYVITINLVRHLYRNLVCMWAITNKMRLSKYKIYPAEIHLQKAKIPVDDIRLESFSGCSVEAYTSIMNWIQLARNYNKELDAATTYFARKDIKSEIKEYYIKTLLYKPGLLATNLVNTLALAFKSEFSLENIKKDAIEKIIESHILNNRSNDYCEKWDKENEFKDYDIKDDSFARTLFNDRKDEFFDMLNKDARIECGKNYAGEFKLLFLEFDE